MSAVGAVQGWWGSLAHRGGAARGDIIGGLTAAVVLLSIEGSYGLVAFGKLGPEQAQLGFILAVCAAVVASFVTVLAGGRGPMLSGSAAAVALLIPALLAALMRDPRFLAADGSPLVPLLLSFTALGVVLAGVMQVLLTAFRLGGLVRYVPYPVHAGYMNGVAVLMVLAVLPHLLGMPVDLKVIDMGQFKPLALLVGVTAFLLSVRAPKWTKPIPAYLVAMGVATLLHHLLSVTPAAGWLGPQFTPPEFTLPGIEVLVPVTQHVRDGLLWDKSFLLLQFAAGVAFMSSLQTALSGSTIDELTHQRRDRGREMFAQGVANIAIGVIGGIPATGATGKTKANLDAGGRTTASRLFFGIGLVLALLIGLRYMAIVPMAAIAGVFSAVGYSLVDAWTRRATGVLWRQSIKWRMPRALAQSYAVMLLVSGIAIFISLPIAIATGMLVAILMFIKSNLKKPVRQIVHADVRRSRKIRPAGESDLLRANGQRIVLLELDGALFFGTAEEADEEIEKRIKVSDYIVLDFERVIEVDASGARVLLQAADSVKRGGKNLLLAGLLPKDPRTRMIRDMDVHARLADANFFPDADHALEHAEDQLLQTLECAATAQALTLDQTLVASGLDAAEQELLASMLVEHRYARGDAVFRSGDPGDAMFVLLHGQIGIRLPAREADDGHGRRLVSYAPGVVFGEMALLAGMSRSADAIAEADAIVLELRREHYDLLMAEHPALLGKLLLNISLLLASRVRALSDELQAARAAR